MTVRFAPPVGLRGRDGRTLWFEGNSKVTAGNGSFDCPAANSFSLIHVADCPGSTPTCRASCYVHGLEEKEPEVHALYRANSVTIREILAEPFAALDWALLVAEYISNEAREGFRWHVSGDIFSEQYARWIRDVCHYSIGVRHWIYTRSFDFAGVLFRTPNLALNLSCDRDNYERARFVRAAGLLVGAKSRLCYLSAEGEVPETLPAGSVIFPDYGLRGRDLERPTDAPWWQGLTPAQRKMVCSVDFFGPSRSNRCGPCKKCLRP